MKGVLLTLLSLALALQGGLLFEHSLHEALLGAFLLLHLLQGGGRHAADDDGLEDGDEVTGGPVQTQCAGVGVAEQEEHERHPAHDLHLRGIARGGGHVHLDDCGRSHEDGQDVHRYLIAHEGEGEHGIHLGEVGHPADEAFAAEFCCGLQHIEEGEEDELVNILKLT